MSAGGCRQVALDKPVDEAEPPRGNDVDRLAADGDTQRLDRSDQARKSIGPPGAGDQSELYFRQAESGIATRDTIVTCQRHFEAAAQRRPMDRRDDGLGTGFDTAAQIAQGGRLSRLAELPDV